MKNVVLKIKAKELAEEAKFVRREEHAAYKSFVHSRNSQIFDRANRALIGFQNLQNHRKTVIREEARATHLARMFIAGVPYSLVESNTAPLPEYLLEKVVRMVHLYRENPMGFRTKIRPPITDLDAYAAQRFAVLEDLVLWMGPNDAG